MFHLGCGGNTGQVMRRGLASEVLVEIIGGERGAHKPLFELDWNAVCQVNQERVQQGGTGRDRKLCG